MLPARWRRFASLLTQFTSFDRPSVDRFRRSHRLRLERFEDRFAPATHTWTGMTNNLWSLDTNWTGGSPVGDSLAALVFPASATNVVNTNDLDNLTIRSIRFTGSKAYTIDGSALTLNSGGIALASSVATATDTLNFDIMLGASQTWRITAAGATLDVEGVISGKHRLTKSDAGTLVLGATNLYNGTTLNAGTLMVGTGQSLGPGTLTFHGGRIQSATPLTLANAFTVTASPCLVKI